MLHWPDSMFSFLEEDGLLISSDAFGAHYASSERFDDEVETGELMHQAGKYYANILNPYSPLVLGLLEQVRKLGLNINMIAPDHGVIWRKDPGRILRLTRTGEPRKHGRSPWSFSIPCGTAPRRWPKRSGRDSWRRGFPYR